MTFHRWNTLKVVKSFIVLEKEENIQKQTASVFNRKSDSPQNKQDKDLANLIKIELKQKF